MESKKEVAIIGAGAVGLYLSWKLAKKGFKVTVFEKRERVGLKACSCLISERIKNFIPFKENLIENKIKYSLIHFPKKDIRLDFKPVHFVLNRSDFDSELKKMAEKEGVKIIFSKEIKEIPKGFFRVIGCDGALSSIRDSLSLNSPSFRLGVRIFKKGEINKNERVETWPLKNGFCWKIPKKDIIEYGALGNVNSLKDNFEKFCSDQNISFFWDEAESALVPQGLVLPKKKKVTLCGDSSGLTKPWSGGGIIWGFKQADIMLKHFPDFGKYRREVFSFFGFKILKGKICSNFACFLGNNFPFLLPGRISRDNDFPLF